MMWNVGDSYMKSAIFYGNEHICLEELPEPVVKPGYVKIKTAYCGICGNDIIRYYGTQEILPAKCPSFPVVLGHEVSGVVCEIGENVSSVSVGSRVSVQPNIYCGHCDACLSGAPFACSQLEMIGWKLDGGMSEYICVPERNVFPIADDMPLLDAAVFQCGAFSFASVLDSGLKKGDACLVLGSGAAALFVIQAAKWIGADKIVVLDVPKGQEALVKQQGATHTVPPNTDLRRELQSICGTHRFDHVFDTIAIDSSIATAIECLTFFGTLSIILNDFAFSDAFLISYRDFLLKPNTIKFCVSPYIGRYSELLELARKKIMNVASTISNIIPLNEISERAPEAFSLAGSNVKTVIQISDSF